MRHFVRVHSFTRVWIADREYPRVPDSRRIHHCDHGARLWRHGRQFEGVELATNRAFINRVPRREYRDDRMLVRKLVPQRLRADPRIMDELNAAGLTAIPLRAPETTVLLGAVRTARETLFLNPYPW